MTRNQERRGALDVGFGDGRPTFSVGVQEKVIESEGPPRIGVALQHARVPPEGTDIFSPLRIPDLARLALRSIDPTLVESARAELTATLAPGVHEVPLGDGHPVQIELAPGSRARVALDVASEDDGKGRPVPVIRRLTMDFDQPIIIHNVFEALVELQTLFEDRTLSSVLRALPEKAGFGSLRALLPARLRELASMLRQADQAGTIALERVVATPRWRPRNHSWELRVAFSGVVRLLNRVERPFADVELPNMLLPTPHARLDRLLSSRPLASARVSAKRRMVLPFMRAVATSVTGAGGRFRVRMGLPEIEVGGMLVAGTRCTAALRPPPVVMLAGDIDIEARDGGLRIVAPALDAGFDGGDLELGATVDLEYDLGDEPRPAAERIEFDTKIEVREGSRIPSVDLELRVDHPLCSGGTRTALRLTDVEVSGRGQLGYGKGVLALRPTADTFRFAGGLATRDAVEQTTTHGRGRTRITGGQFSSRLELDRRGVWQLSVAGDAAYHHTLTMDVPDIPEISVESGALEGDIVGRCSYEGGVRLTFPRRNSPRLDLAGNRFATTLERCELRLGGRKLAVPAGTEFRTTVAEGGWGASGPGRFVVNVAWNLQGQPCLLSDETGRSVSLLAEGLRRGELDAVLDDGRLGFEGESQGLYGVRYFNALINPSANPEHLWNILRSEEALNHVVRALEVFAPDFAETVADVRSLVLTARDILRREGIEEPRHFIPRDRMARTFSLMLVGNEALRARLEAIIHQVTEGKGLDVPGLKAILREQLDDFQLDYEIDRIVRWLDVALSPTAALPTRRVPVELPPVAEDLALADFRKDLPSAEEIYAAVANQTLEGTLLERVATLAPYLRVPQLEWILAHEDGRWPSALTARLRYAYEVKHRIGKTRDAYGGMVHAPQASTIAIYLGEVCDDLFAAGKAPGAEISPVALAGLGPEEVATLLQAGLATGRQGRRTQVNNRLLIEAMQRREDDFVLEVLVELGRYSPAALSNSLFAFLDQDQDEMREPLDLAAFLETKLGIPVPRQRDYLAGGRKARECYTEALDTLASEILARAPRYITRKRHLTTMRHSPTGPDRRTPRKAAPLVREARAAIEEADRRGAEVDKARSRARAARSATAAYEMAFEACAAVLKADPLAFQRGWFKRFWSRNEEALKVLSVVRNYQDSIDDVRFWLHTRLGDDTPIEDEQRLVEAVIEALYLEPGDRAQLRKDPLVRLLIDPPPGRYDFTVVSAMGVITEGARGRELVDAYRRLWEQRGVRVIRADTATSRSLEYNAARIIEAVQRIEGPWGWVGYSQGCANGLMAEARLLGGTPPEQALLERFVCRNLLFSAANGSAHGTSGNLKLARALILGERLLKPYQATVSGPAREAFFRAVRAVLDSRHTSQALGGWYSLSFERAVDFYRDLQIVERAPTSSTRGVCDAKSVPETLEYMLYVLDHLQPGTRHDSQVVLEDSVAESTQVDNPWTRALARVNMGSMPQNIHHWSPLTDEIEFVRTERDKAWAIYESPKDRHVFPWLDVNARFGLIRRLRAGAGAGAPCT